MPASHRLVSLHAPWVHVLALESGQSALAALTPPPSFAVKIVDGLTCSTKDRLLNELARALSFPDYFDPNWDALEECLCDLEWLPADGYVLLFDRANQLLAEEPGARNTLFSVLRSAGKHWASQCPPKSFRTLLIVTERPQAIGKAWRIALWNPARQT
ncbi:hypothetical protein YTPLAS18_38050 [Nitrospira sp.]|nr:hypothetical protein YTPLAS18_38050 [Nitrospira sp.]